MTQKTPSICPTCNAQFVAGRSNQKYCSGNCRKNRYQKEYRSKNPQNSQHSPTVKRDNMEIIDTAMRLTEMLYTMKPDQRLGFVKEIIDAARSGNARLRKILTNEYLLAAGLDKKRLFWRGCWNSPNITKVANKYCRKFWNAGVIDVVRGEAPEPPTGECIEKPQTVVSIYKGIVLSHIGSKLIESRP